MVPASAAAPRLHNLHHTLAVREFDSPRQPKLPLGRRPSGSLLCWCKEVTKKHLESRASLGGPAQGIREGLKTPYTTRPPQTETLFASLATKDLHAKRMTRRSCGAVHGQRKVIRSACGRAEALALKVIKTRRGRADARMETRSDLPEAAVAFAGRLP